MPNKNDVLRALIKKKIQEKSVGVSSVDSSETDIPVSTLAKAPEKIDAMRPVNKTLNALAALGTVNPMMRPITMLQGAREKLFHNTGIKEDTAGFRESAKILPDATQLIGSVASKTPLGIMGRSALGGVSRGIGEIARQGINTQLGGDSPDLKNIMKEAGLGMAGEALVGRGSIAEKYISKFGSKIFDTAKSLDAKMGGGGAKALGNFIRFTTGRQHIDDATELVVKQGPDKVLRKDYMTDDVPKEITRKIKGALDEFDSITKEKYKVLTAPFRDAGLEVPTDEIVSGALQNMDKSGLITKAPEYISKEAFAKLSPQRKWLVIHGYDVPSSFKEEVVGSIENSVGKMMKISTKNTMPIENAIEDRKIIGRQIYGIKSRAIPTAPGKMSQEDSALESLRQSYRSAIYKQTGGETGDFAIADKLYSERENILGELYNKTKTWKDLDKTSRTYMKLSGPEKEALQQVNEMVSKDNKFVDDVLRYSAAQIYKDESTNMFRTGLIGTIIGGLGGAFMPGDPGTRIGTGAVIGATLGTPKAVAYLLKGGQSTKKILEGLAKISAKGAIRSMPTLVSNNIKEKI